MNTPQIYRLMRLLKRDRSVVTVVEIATLDGYRSLWQWIGGANGVVHPDPLCSFWIEERGASAQLPVNESHLIRSEA